MDIGPVDYLFLFLYLIMAGASAVFLYVVGMKRWVGHLRHPKFRRQTMAWWGIGIFGLLESTYWWPQLKETWTWWPLRDIVPAPVALLFAIWVVVLILLYQRAVRPVTVA